MPTAEEKSIIPKSLASLEEEMRLAWRKYGWIAFTAGILVAILVIKDIISKRLK